MADLLGIGNITRENQIRELQKELDDLKKQLDEKKTEEMPGKYRIAKAMLEESKILYEWEAPVRTHVRRGRQWYWTVALVVLAIVVILAFLQELILIGAVIAFMFLVYVAATVPPGDTKYKFTEHGLEIGEGENANVYSWDQMTNFWFSFKNGREVVNVETKISFPRQISLLFGRTQKKNIIKVLEERLPYKEPPKKQGWVDRTTDGVYIPYQEAKSSAKAGPSETGVKTEPTP